MIRGTTAQFKFRIPYDFNDLEYVKVIFWQKGNDGPDIDRPLPIIKNENDCRWYVSDNMVTVSLEPEETARFLDDRKAYTQLISKTTSGIDFASRQYEISVYPIYGDFILGDIVPPSEGNGVIILDGGTIK